MLYAVLLLLPDLRYGLLNLEALFRPQNVVLDQVNCLNVATLNLLKFVCRSILALVKFDHVQLSTLWTYSRFGQFPQSWINVATGP